MKVRIWGLPEENTRVAQALRAAFAVVDESGDYPPSRGTSPLRRRYVELRLDAPTPADSPLALAEDAKRARDLGREIAVLTGAGHDLETQPWYPLQVGDVVLTYMPDSTPAGGPLSETYLAVNDGFEVRLREVANSYSAQLDTADDGTGTGDQADAHDAQPVDGDQPEHADDGEQVGAEDDGQDDAPDAAGELLASIWDLWFEWGPAAITVIRAGAVVYGIPGRARPTAKSRP